MPQTSDTRVKAYDPLLAPMALLDELPLDDGLAKTVEQARADICSVLDGVNDRLLVIVGPCSVHDPLAALEYAARLRDIAQSLADDLLIVKRVYFEKPRTVSGWKGLINDPRLDGSYDVHRGLRTARRLLLDILELGLPVGCEWLDPVTPQYIADTVAWGAIGARTVESQAHRQLASGLSMPIGFKNSTDGNVQVAVDGCRAAATGHTFFGVTPAGAAAVVTTAGNPDCHVILRGGRTGPNYQEGQVMRALAAITEAGLPRRVMVDASHGNSGKDHRKQPVVAQALADQIAAGEQGVVGVMLESFLRAGRQELEGPGTLVFGQSITDACMDIDTTATVLDNLAAAARRRRGKTALTRCETRSEPSKPVPRG
jgi:3-deoxy-7-phosphoheptulonate synthase